MQTKQHQHIERTSIFTWPVTGCFPIDVPVQDNVGGLTEALLQVDAYSAQNVPVRWGHKTRCWGYISTRFKSRLLLSMIEKLKKFTFKLRTGQTPPGLPGRVGLTTRKSNQTKRNHMYAIHCGSGGFYTLLFDVLPNKTNTPKKNENTR